MCLGSRVEETGGIVTTTVGRSKRVKMYIPYPSHPSRRDLVQSVLS